ARKTAHNAGKKKVLIKNEEAASMLTQAAIGSLSPGDTVEAHMHLDMEEYFYFLSGEGNYVIDGDIWKVIAGTFIKIPAKKQHALVTIGTEPLTFIYWGVALVS
ncbi:MAG: cupin domain-containing protein, partial [Bacteroidota bacterium]